jgi:tetratricopeptide (TPR) repeat protein
MEMIEYVLAARRFPMIRRSLLAFLALTVAPLYSEALDISTAPVTTTPRTDLPSPGNPEDLRREAASLEKDRKTSPRPWLLMGRAYLAEKRPGKALSALNKALKRDPYNAEAYYWRGRVFEEKGKPDEAANEYQAALKVDASYTEAKTAWERLRANVDTDD